MTNNTRNRKYSHPSRIDRIERKCDRILSELLIVRQQLNKESDMDTVIDRLHTTAIRMRRQCNKERALVRTMFNSKFPEQ